MSSSNRERYTLGHGVYSGEITLESGDNIQIEYGQAVIGSVANLEDLQDILEYIAARVCEEEGYNYIRIRYDVLHVIIQTGQTH